MEQVNPSSNSCLISITTTTNIVMKSIKLTDSFDIVSFLIIMKKQAVTQQNFH